MESAQQTHALEKETRCLKENNVSKWLSLGLPFKRHTPDCYIENQD